MSICCSRSCNRSPVLHATITWTIPQRFSPTAIGPVENIACYEQWIGHIFHLGAQRGLLPGPNAYPRSFPPGLRDPENSSLEHSPHAITFGTTLPTQTSKSMHANAVSCNSCPQMFPGVQIMWETDGGSPLLIPQWMNCTMKKVRQLNSQVVHQSTTRWR